jgi:hypothetical protein
VRACLTDRRKVAWLETDLDALRGELVAVIRGHYAAGQLRFVMVPAGRGLERENVRQLRGIFGPNKTS